MSALEVIEQIKALPPKEKALVMEFVHQLEATAPEVIRYVDRPALETTAEKIFDQHDDLFRKLAQ